MPVQFIAYDVLGSTVTALEEHSTIVAAFAMNDHYVAVFTTPKPRIGRPPKQVETR